MTLVIGIGNPVRGDDAAGIEVARRIRTHASRRDVTVMELFGDQLALLDAWTGARTVYLVDAIHSGGKPGHVHRFDAGEPLDAPFHRPGTHTFSLADVIELSRAMGRLPARLMGYGIEGASFGLGETMSPAVEAAVDSVTSEILRRVKESD
jgi:hydrogenase maturation protease